MQDRKLVYINRWFDNKSIGNTYFNVGNLVVKWDKPCEEKGKHG